MSGSSGWAISHTPSDDDEVDEKPMCQYGARCYRKNPTHLAEFSHPKRLDLDEEEKVKEAPKKAREAEGVAKASLREDTKRKESGRLEDTKRKESGRLETPRARAEEECAKRQKQDDTPKQQQKAREEEWGKRGREEESKAKVKPEQSVRRTPKDDVKPTVAKSEKDWEAKVDTPKQKLSDEDVGKSTVLGKLHEFHKAEIWPPRPTELSSSRTTELGPSRTVELSYGPKTSELGAPKPKLAAEEVLRPKPKIAEEGLLKPSKLEVKEELATTESEIAKKEKPMCKYGIKCFRKNLVHFAEFDHPIAGGAATVESSAPRKEMEREEEPKKATKTPPAKKQKMTDPDDVWPSTEEDDDGVELPPELTRSYSSMTEKERKQLIADAIKAKARMEEEMKKKEADLIELMKRKEADLMKLMQQKEEQEKKSAEVEKLLKMKGQEADSLRKKGEEATLTLKAHQEEAQRILKLKQEAEDQLKQTKKAAQHLLKKKDEAVAKEKERALVLLKQKEAEAESKLAAVTAEAKQKWDDYKEQLKKDLVKAQESLRQGSGGHMLVKGEAEALESSKTVLFPLYAQRTHDNSAEQAHFRLAESQFYRLLENNDYRVTMVEYVVSPAVVARYKKAIAALTEQRAKDMTPEAIRKLKEGQAHTEARCVLDPVLGFHGTATKNIASICEHGFKVPGGTEGFTHSTDAGWYGRGVYFSEFPSYAMEYITSGTKLLLCQVVLGKIYHCTKLIHGAPLQAGYDSHMSPDGKEVVIFNSEHILPSYVVHYTKKTGQFEYSRPKPVDDSEEEAPWQKSKDAAEALVHAKKRLDAKGDEESKVFKGVVFVTCGKLLLSVKAMNEMLEEFAGSVATNVSSEVSFVLSTQDEVNKKGPKILQAMTKKVPILDQSFAFDCIRNGRYDYKTHQEYLLPVPS